MRQINPIFEELLGNNCNEFNGALTLVNELQDSEKKTFDKQIKLAHKIYKTFEYFKSDECKQQMDLCRCSDDYRRISQASIRLQQIILLRHG